MSTPFFSPINMLRVLAHLEGSTLILLVLVAVPLKYIMQYPQLVNGLGPAHGAFFMLFVLNALKVAIEQQWPVRTTLKVLFSSLIPFGTFYVDRKILRKLR